MSDITLLYFGVGILYILASTSIIFNVIMVDKLRELRSDVETDIINESALMDEKIMDTIKWSDETKWKMQYICNQIDGIEKRLDVLEKYTQLDSDDIGMIGSELTFTQSDIVDLREQIEGIKAYQREQDSTISYMQEHMEVKK